MIPNEAIEAAQIAYRAYVKEWQWSIDGSEDDAMRAALSAAAPLMAEIPTILDDRDRLRKALRGMFCPRPCNRHPDDIEVGLCVDAGECGCGARAALGDAG